MDNTIKASVGTNLLPINAKERCDVPPEMIGESDEYGEVVGILIDDNAYRLANNIVDDANGEIDSVDIELPNGTVVTFTIED